MSDPRRTVRLNDPKAMRALAHPVRLQLLAELRVRGPQSVKMLGELLDEAPGSVSYHVGKLAEFGFVVAAPELARDRRERWWRAAHAETAIEPVGVAADPRGHVASSRLRRSMLQRNYDGLQRYLDAELSMDVEWVRAAAIGDAFLQLTSAQLLELRAELEALVRRWQARTPDPGDGPTSEPTDAHAVTLIYQAFRRP